mmetsp:Transcript_17425/g.44375  ORF Transcript_17425/g.44375 Transcript_17425/m.44375 type:complete len:373 (+) Transcript_17425:569-1687(+)
MKFFTRLMRLSSKSLNWFSSQYFSVTHTRIWMALARASPTVLAGTAYLCSSFSNNRHGVVKERCVTMNVFMNLGSNFTSDVRASTSLLSVPMLTFAGFSSAQEYWSFLAPLFSFQIFTSKISSTMASIILLPSSPSSLRRRASVFMVFSSSLMASASALHVDATCSSEDCGTMPPLFWLMELSAAIMMTASTRNELVFCHIFCRMLNTMRPRACPTAAFSTFSSTWCSPASLCSRSRHSMVLMMIFSMVVMPGFPRVDSVTAFFKMLNRSVVTESHAVRWSLTCASRQQPLLEIISSRAASCSWCWISATVPSGGAAFMKSISEGRFDMVLMRTVRRHSEKLGAERKLDSSLSARSWSAPSPPPLRLMYAPT